MSEFLLNQRQGLSVSYIPQHDGTFLIKHSTDGDALRYTLDQNKALANHDDGYVSSAREMRRAAYIPDPVILMWAAEGIDVYNPDHAKDVAKKLNSSEWQHLRTAPGRI